MNGRDSSDRYSLIESLYQRAVDLPTDRRAAFLSTECGADARLRAEIESLLEHYEAAPDGFLERPAHALEWRAETHAAVPQCVGSYRIIRLLGRGGMGAVYEAQQAQPTRRVALKVVRSDAVSEETLRRFRHEADVLAQLHDPGIAQVYEFGVGEVRFNGVTTHRQPFFAMELVHGRALGEYAASPPPLQRRALLELFARVCDAVQHAHQKGVIHRDLKPANVLVTDQGLPKVLDFGVARITSAGRGTTLTHAGHVLGTLGYMSPEQAAGDLRALDTRSDVYALGVILYELLAGRLPLDCRECSLTEAARIIREQRPPPLRWIDPSLGGDVETIVAKTLEKEPARRYQSAGELGRDVRRYLAGEAIEARRDSAWYVLRKQMARYKAALAVAVTFLLVIAGSSVALTFLYDSQTRERRRAEAAQQDAEQSAAHADAVKTFLEQMLLAADAQRRQGRDLTLREVLDDAGARLQQGLLADSPKASVDVRWTLAQTYMNLGLYRSAIPHYQWLYDHHRSTVGPDHPMTVRSLLGLGQGQMGAYRHPDARATLESALEAAVRLQPPDTELVLTAMDRLGQVLLALGHVEEAESMHREAFDRIEQEPREDHELFASLADNLAYASRLRGEISEAERLFTQALEAAERQHGPDSSVTNRIRLHLAQDVYNKTGRHDQAVSLLHQALESSRRGLGPEHVDTNRVVIVLSRVLRSQGRLDDAEEVLREAVESQRTVHGIERFDALHVMGELAGLQSAQGDHDQAVLTLEDGLARAIDAHGEEYDETARWMFHLANYVGDMGDFGRAAQIAQRCLHVRERVFDPDHEIVGESLQQLGWFASCAAEYDEAQRRYQRALEIRRARLGESHFETIRSTITLAHALFYGGDAETALAMLRTKYESLRAELGETHRNTRYAASYLSNLLGYDGRHDEAIDLCNRLITVLAGEFGEDHLATATWWARSGWHLYNSGDAGRAADAYRRALTIYQTAQEDPGAPSTSASIVKYRLAEALSLLGDGASAEPLARQAWTHLHAAYGEDDRRVVLAKCSLARALLAQGRAGEAETLLRACMATLDTLPLPRAYVLADQGYVLNTLGGCLLALGQQEEGELRLRESEAALRSVRSTPFLPVETDMSSPRSVEIAVSPW